MSEIPEIYKIICDENFNFDEMEDCDIEIYDEEVQFGEDEWEEMDEQELQKH